MAFLPPAVSRRIPRLLQRATQPPYLRAGDLWSHSDGSGVDYYDGSTLKGLTFGNANGPAFEVAAYHYGSATWHDAARSAFAAVLAAGGGTVLFPAGQTLNVDQAGHATLFQLPRDGNGAAEPARTRNPITVDLNGGTLVLGANTRRLMDPTYTALYDWFRDLEICNGAVDASAVPATAANEHLVFGTYNLSSGQACSFERIRVHHITVIGLIAGQTGGGLTGRKHWLAIAPSPILNDTNQIVLREIVVSDCDIAGGDTGFVIYASSPSGGALTQPADFVNALIENCHVLRVRWDSGYTPTAFNSGGAQLGGYALVKNSSVRDSYFKGAGDVGLEMDNCHGALAENVTVENAWNSSFLAGGFGAKDDDQRNRRVTFRNCTSIVSDSRLTACQGWTGYTARHHRLGHVELQGCRHESVALHKLGGGSGVSLGVCVSTTLTQDVAPGNTTYHVATTANIVTGEDIHLGAGAGTTGEWVSVASITDATTFVASAAVNSYDHTNSTQAAVVQPTPSERVTIRDFTVRDIGWSLPAAAAAATYTPIEINHAGALVEIKGLRVQTQGATIATAGQLNVYAVAINGRNLTLDIDGVDAAADLVFGGTQGNYRALALGHLSVMQPLTCRGTVRGLRPTVVQGFPAANATGVYIGDRTQLQLDTGPNALTIHGDYRLLPSGAKEITWQTLGENVLNVALDEASRRRSVATWPRTIRLVEHFLGGGTTTSASIGDTGWGTGDSASGGSVARAGQLGHPGSSLLDTGTVAGGNIRWVALTSAGTACVDLTEWFDLYLWFKLNQVDANTVARVGMAESPVLNPPLYGYWLRLLAGGANMEFVVSNNGGSHVGTANSIAPDTNWHVLRIRRFKDAGVITVGMAVDGGAETTFTAAGDTVLPTTRNATPFAHIANNATTSSEKLYVDEVELVIPNLVLV